MGRRTRQALKRKRGTTDHEQQEEEDGALNEDEKNITTEAKGGDENKSKPRGRKTGKAPKRRQGADDVQQKEKRVLRYDAKKRKPNDEGDDDDVEDDQKVAAVDPKTETAAVEQEKLDIMRSLEQNKYNLEKLKEIQQEILIHDKQARNREEWQRVVMLLDCNREAERFVKNCEESKPASAASKRVEDVWFQVQEQNMLHTFDLDRFIHRVSELFHWHTLHSVQQKTYMAPYFPLVQSSGMGKTKLLFEFRKYVEQQNPIKDEVAAANDNPFSDCDCKTVLCMNGPNGSVGDEGHVFSTEIALLKSEALDRNNVCNILNKILDNCKKSKLVLLFDESQNLLANDGFYFRAVRWWLRLKRAEEKPKVVAVFTGTTSKLTNFYKEPPESSTSRDGNKQYYLGGEALYPPFYDICTIGLLSSPSSLSESAAVAVVETEYEQAIPHGRPLFALMHKDKLLSNPKLFNILSRMLLFQSTNDWTKSLEACLSVLGTRIQMGQMSVQLSSDLVANGYALWTHYSAPPVQGPQSTVARVSFPPDPVCARLAMGLMDEDWSLASETKIKGQSKTFWVKMMSKIFSQGLCLPSQGNLGELGAALYLLFCGDLIRKLQQQKLIRQEDPSKSLNKEDSDSVAKHDYTTFSVPLEDFIDCISKPNNYYSPEDENDDEDDQGKEEIEIEETDEELDEDEAEIDYNHALVENADDKGPRGSQEYRTVPLDLDSTVSVSDNAKSSTNDIDMAETTLAESEAQLVEKKPLYKSADIGFIQVVGNNLRFSIQQISKQAFLSSLYQSGCAFYAYPLCHTFDMVGSIRLTSANDELKHYVPLLVSVSTIHHKGSQSAHLKSMEQLLRDAGTFGLCIRLRFARPGQRTSRMKILLAKEDVTSLLGGEIVSKKVVVPANDPFGIVKVLLETTSFGPPECEVYSSHYFYQLEEPSPTTGRTLLRTRTRKGVVEYAGNMHKALWDKMCRSDGV